MNDSKMDCAADLFGNGFQGSVPQVPPAIIRGSMKHFIYALSELLLVNDDLLACGSEGR